MNIKIEFACKRLLTITFSEYFLSNRTRPIVTGTCPRT
jgi:hypothetical protein